MNVSRLVLVSMVFASLCDCATSAPRAALFKLDSRPSGGSRVFARIMPVGGWQKLKPESTGLITYLGPDNYATFQFRAQPVTVTEAACGKYAEEHAHDLAYTLEKGMRAYEKTDPARTNASEVLTEQVTPNAADPSSFDFRLRIVDHNRNTPDRIVLGRTLCRPAGLAAGLCTVVEGRVGSLSSDCTQMLATLEISDHANPEEAKLAYDADSLSSGVSRNGK